MSQNKYTWYKIASYIGQIEFGTNNIVVVELKRKTICLGKFNDKLFAFAYQCPHAGGILAEGFIDALGNVVCPIHRYKFDIRNGRNVSGEGYYMKHWPVEIREKGVYVGLEDTGSFWNIFR
jgi:nitrite reductase/ring-hydroxylating ferredoxin subunit